MTETPHPEAGAAFLRLLSWVSPAFPTGGYAYSHGLEWAVESGDVTDVATLCDWIGCLLEHGAPGSDLIILQEAWSAAHDMPRLRELAEFSCACASSRERYDETVYQGEAFLKAASVWPVTPDPSELRATRWPLPVAQGLVFRRGGITREEALLSGGYATIAALVSAAVRLVPLGQTDGLHALARLEPLLSRAVTVTKNRTLDDVGGACFRSDLAAMHHETQTTRLFRT
ncbi:urease accessory protein UreF [Gluconobacter oxydans]|uniref:urease accessory protein UreF n=1 Tax=Gluconobacter oxydans TaxID=442 RepID=UPI0039E8F900